MAKLKLCLAGIYDYVKCVFQLSEWNGANAVTVHEMAFDDQQLASLPDGLFPWKHTNKRKIVNHSFDEKLNLRYKALFPDKDGYWSLWKETQVRTISLIKLYLPDKPAHLSHLSRGHLNTALLITVI